ncbi:MAG: hypothetical protein GX556_07080 [Fibrobacter sp.]|nr:hypothetical protein [Fibrobacter sp.]
MIFKPVITRNSRHNPLLLTFILFTLSIMFSHTVNAGPDTSKQILNGGMFYHLGPAQISSDHGNIDGLTMGLGGRIAFNLGRSLRVGGMGFGSGFSYKSASGADGSFVRLKGGGITAEYVLSFSDQLRLSLGVLAGMGSLHHLHVISDNGDTMFVTNDKYGTAIGSPILLFEYLFGRSYALCFMGNWLMGNKIASGKSFGPCFHIGILFNR